MRGLGIVDKLKLLSVVLVVALVISIGAAVYVENQNVALSDQKTVLSSETDSQATRIEMVSLLSQMQVQAERSCSRWAKVWCMLPSSFPPQASAVTKRGLLLAIWLQAVLSRLKPALRTLTAP
jgi:hypothetical protein